MENITLQEIVLIIGVLSVIFSVFLYFKNPQIKAEKFDALIKQNIEFLQKEFSEKFIGFDKQLCNLKDNHLHTMSEDIKSLTKTVNELAVLVGKLETKIDERIPRKM